MNKTSQATNAMPYRTQTNPLRTLTLTLSHFTTLLLMPRLRLWRRFWLGLCPCVMLCVTMQAGFAAPANTAALGSQKNIILNTASSTSTGLPAKVSQALKQANVPDTAISAQVVSLSTGQVYVSHLPNQKRLPASTLKLVTTFAALDALGADYRWQTGIFHTGKIKNGVLHGDLIIKGSGDPKLVLERITELFAALKAKGVSHITGDMVLDNSVFIGTKHDPSAFDGKGLRPYNVAPDGLLVNFGAMIYKFYPDATSDQAWVAHEPAISGVSIPYAVPLNDDSCGDWRSGLGGSFSASKVSFSGSYPAACGEQYWPVAYPDASAFAPKVLLGMWQSAGGSLAGKARWGKLPKKATWLYNQPSLPLASLITDINQYSNNVMTEQVFLSLPVASGAYKASSYKRSRAWMAHWWQAHLDDAPPHFSKASGLCRDCLVTSAQLIKLLKLADDHPQSATFKNSLGLAGLSGTIARFGERMPTSPAIGRAHIKTGTLNDVASIAGYIDSINGKHLAIIAIINHDHAADAKPALDALMDWAAKL